MPFGATLTILLHCALPAAAQRPEPAARLDLHGDPLPPGAVARLGTSRLRFGTSVLSGVEFMPDGKALVTASPDLGLRLWDTTTGKLLARDDGPLASGRVAVAPDGRWVVAETRDGLCFWKPRAARRVAAPLAGGDQLLVGALAFAPNGSRLAVATLERRTDRATIHVLDVPAGREQFRIAAHKVPVTHMAFTPDGQTLVSIDQGFNIYHHDTRNGSRQKDISLVPTETAQGGSWPGEVRRLSPDSRTLLRVLRSKGQVSIWDTATGKQLRTLDWIPDITFWIDVTADGKVLAVLASKDQHLFPVTFDLATGNRLRQIELPMKSAEYNRAFRLAPDGRTAAVLSSTGGAVRLWDLVNGQLVSFPDGHTFVVNALNVSPDGRTVVSADSTEVRGWNLADGLPCWAVETGNTRGTAVLPDGHTVVACRSDGRLEFRDLATGRLLREEAFPEPRYGVSQFAVTADGSTALSLQHASPQEMILAVHRVGPEGEADRQLPLGKTIGGVFAPHGRWVATRDNDGRRLVLLDTTTGRPRPVLANAAVTRPGAVSADGRLLVAVNTTAISQGERTPAIMHSQFHFAEVLTGRALLTVANAASGPNASVSCLEFTPDGRTLAFAISDRSLVLLNVATGRERLRLSGIDAPISSLTFTPDGSRLLSGHFDGTILVWDVAAATRREPAPAATDAQLDSWWAELAGDDAAKAYQAVCALSDAPGQAAPVLQARLKPVAAPVDQIRKLLADLDSPRYPVREAASRQLAELGDVAEPALRHALAASESLEQRLRLQSLVDGLGEVRSPEVRRLVRAVWALERAGTPETVRMLEELGRGPADARLTQEARDALARLRRLTQKAD